MGNELRGVQAHSADYFGDKFRLTRGELKMFVKVAESGRRRALGFCSECGSRILAKPEEGEPGFISLRAGSIRQRSELRPRAQVWARSAQQWIDELPRLPRIDQQRLDQQPLLAATSKE